MTPERIQRKRTRGWRMPENTIYVGRPSKWGNRFGVGHSRLSPQDRIDCVELFRKWIHLCEERGLVAINDLSLLRGKNLACWCPLN